MIESIWEQRTGQWHFYLWVQLCNWQIMFGILLNIINFKSMDLIKNGDYLQILVTQKQVSEIFKNKSSSMDSNANIVRQNINIKKAIQTYQYTPKIAQILFPLQTDTALYALEQLNNLQYHISHNLNTRIDQQQNIAYLKEVKDIKKQLEQKMLDLEYPEYKINKLESNQKDQEGQEVNKINLLLLVTSEFCSKLKQMQIKMQSLPEDLGIRLRQMQSILYVLSSSLMEQKLDEKEFRGIQSLTFMVQKTQSTNIVIDMSEQVQKILQKLGVYRQMYEEAFKLMDQIQEMVQMHKSMQCESQQYVKLMGQVHNNLKESKRKALQQMGKLQKNIQSTSK